MPFEAIKDKRTKRRLSRRPSRPSRRWAGSRQHKHEHNEAGVFHCERSYGSFQRSIALPPGVDPQSVDARFEDGVLEISMPIPEQRQRGRSIPINAGGRGGDGNKPRS